MKAKDIMTTPVITITPDTSIRDAASLLLERRISGLPVVEGDRVVGILSEGDLLRRHEIDNGGKHPQGPWWMRLLHGEPGAAEYVKSHAVRAADVMTSDVVCVSEDADVARIAALLARRKIKRMPVLRGERLVGIVTRANVVQALARAMQGGKRQLPLDDAAIRARLLEELSQHAWWHGTSNVSVTGGTVHYWGVCENEHEKHAARVAAENVPGVRCIQDHRVTYAQLPSMG